MARHGRLLTNALTLLGSASGAALVALALVGGRPGDLLPAFLALAFFAAGVLGTRARADHSGVQLLLAVGALHLFAFATALGIDAGPTSPWAAWVLATVSGAAFQAAFVALAVLLAAYPDARLTTAPLRLFAGVCVAGWAVTVAVESLFLRELPLALNDTAPVPAPSPLPLAVSPVDPQQAMPLLVVAAAVVLVARARRTPTEDRGPLTWAALAGTLVALLLVGSVAASRLLPDLVITVAFVGVVSLVPFALLAGLVRYRLLEVDLLLVRTVARGVLLVAVLAAYAFLATLLARQEQAYTAASVTLMLLAVVTGGRLLQGAEAVADRLVTGGRVRRATLSRSLDAVLVAADPDHLADAVSRRIGQALDVSWVRCVVDGVVVGAYGEAATPAVEVVRLETAGTSVGLLECGPRRGGWGDRDRAVLRGAGTRAAAALHAARLSAQLAERVDELTSSRARLVRAEDSVRRQMERDLHDGLQQQLVALLTRLTVARELLGTDKAALPALQAAHDLAGEALADLRRLVIGIHPALLDDRGLAAAVEARAALLPIIVTVDIDPRVSVDRYPDDVERAAYYVVSEALTNVMKHSGSDHARVVIAPLPGGGVRVAVTDEGCGTATYAGTGLAGLRDRVEACGGRFDLMATPDVGTTVVADFDARERKAAMTAHA